MNKGGSMKKIITVLFSFLFVVNLTQITYAVDNKEDKFVDTVANLTVQFNYFLKNEEYKKTNEYTFTEISEKIYVELKDVETPKDNKKAELLNLYIKMYESRWLMYLSNDLYKETRKASYLSRLDENKSLDSFYLKKITSTSLERAISQRRKDLVEKYEFEIKPFIIVVNREDISSLVESPYNRDGVTMVPLRAILEPFKITPVWNDQTRTIEIIKDESTVVIQIDSQTAYSNGEQIELEVAPEISHEITMVPLRFLAEALGYEVDWYRGYKKITIEKANEN
jgi:hypothetical protein